jgi:hypothetical protein
MKRLLLALLLAASVAHAQENPLHAGPRDWTLVRTWADGRTSQINALTAAECERLKGSIRGSVDPTDYSRRTDVNFCVQDK